MVQYRDPGPIVFDALIERPEGPGAYVTLPFNDTVDYTGSLAPYGGQHRLGVRKDIQRSLGKNHGDTVSVQLILDTDRADVAGSD